MTERQDAHDVADPVRRLVSGEGKNIPLFRVFMPESVMEPLRRVLLGGYLGEGPQVEEFERQLQPWFGTPHVLTLNTGTAAIHLALRLAGVGQGDEVISTPMTCAATNVPVLARGATIVWGDIDPWTGNLDPADVAKKITARTRAILCVHWGGYPCDLAELGHLAAAHGLALIEDACHAFGAQYRGQPVGAHGDFCCFSFQAIKELTTVDGGALTCRSAADCVRGRRLRWYGIDRRAPRTDLRCEADIVEYGDKYHMHDVAATIGLEQLRYVGANLERTRRHAARYRDALQGLRRVALLRYQPDRLSSYWLHTLRVRDRAAFIAALDRAGITASRVHARNDTHTMCRAFRRPLPGVDEFDAEQVSIPVGWWLGDDEVARIIAAVRAYGDAAG